MPETTPQQRPEELIRLERLGTALSSLGLESPTWRALDEVFNEFLDESREQAHNPQAAEEKRAFWNGADYAVFELWKELRDLRSGAWKQWPNVARLRQQSGEDED